VTAYQRRRFRRREEGVDLVASVVAAQMEASARGAVTMWTIYDRPKDHPHGFIARRFEVGRGTSTATAHTLAGDLDDIREILAQAGLTNICRQADDEPQVVESWI
jgi:hypothetical protein